MQYWYKKAAPVLAVLLLAASSGCGSGDDQSTDAAAAASGGGAVASGALCGDAIRGPIYFNAQGYYVNSAAAIGGVQPWTNASVGNIAVGQNVPTGNTYSGVGVDGAIVLGVNSTPNTFNGTYGALPYPNSAYGFSNYSNMYGNSASGGGYIQMSSYLAQQILFENGGLSGFTGWNTPFSGTASNWFLVPGYPNGALPAAGNVCVIGVGFNLTKHDGYDLFGNYNNLYGGMVFVYVRDVAGNPHGYAMSF